MHKNLTILSCGLMVAAGVWAQTSTPTQSSNPNPYGTPQTGTQANANNTAGMSGPDSKFAYDAAEGGMAEVQIGQLAQQHAQNQQVKDFAARMVADHSKADDELKGVFMQEGKTMPASLNSKDQALYDKLSGLSGADFDRTYMSAMVRDHRTDIAGFKKEANSGKNAQLRSFATNTLPTLQEHLRLAQQAASAVGAKSSE